MPGLGQPGALAVAVHRVTSPATRAAQRARSPSRCAEPRAPALPLAAPSDTPLCCARTPSHAAICRRWNRARPRTGPSLRSHPVPKAPSPRAQAEMWVPSSSRYYRWAEDMPMPGIGGEQRSSKCQGPVFQHKPFRLGPPNLRGLDLHLLLKSGPSTSLPRPS